VQNAAIVRAETSVRYEPEHTDGGEPMPLAVFVCSCVVYFCKHSRGEFIATLKFMSSAARSFIFAQPGRHGILWVSTLELAMQAQADPGFEGGPSAKRICFGKTGESSCQHHFAWDAAGPIVTLWTYTQRPLGIPLDSPGAVLQTLIDMDYLGISHTLHDDTYAPASDLQAYPWFSTEMLEWWAAHPHLPMPPTLRRMRAAYELEAQRAGLSLVEPPRFDAHPDTMRYVCSRCKTPKAKGARCKVLLCIAPKAEAKAAGARAAELPATSAEEDSAGPAPAATAGLAVSTGGGTGSDVSNADLPENVCARCKEPKVKNARCKVPGCVSKKLAPHPGSQPVLQTVMPPREAPTGMTSVSA